MTSDGRLSVSVSLSPSLPPSLSLSLSLVHPLWLLLRMTSSFGQRAEEEDVMGSGRC